MSTLALAFLGQLAVYIDEQLAPLPTRKAAVLLAYLAIHEGSHTRDTLAALFWPNADQARARASLRQTLWTLRRTGLEIWLTLDPATIGLQAGFSLDVAAFRGHAALAAAHEHDTVQPCSECVGWLSQAAEAYRGDFLAGISLPDCPELEDWQRAQAESLRQDLAGVLERLSAHHALARDWKAAIQVARRWVALDQLHEPAQRALMRWYDCTGQRRMALAQYDLLRELLARELGVEPEPATQQLWRELSTGHIVSPNGVGLDPAERPGHNLPVTLTTFVGREEDIATAKRRLGNVRLLTLTGPGGVGKTRLAVEVAQGMIDVFTGGVWFVSLASLTDPGLVAHTIAANLGLSNEPGLPILDSLTRYLRPRQSLLVIDNCEHLIEDCAPLAGRLLSSCRGLKILATSRERLGIGGEAAIVIASLPFPVIGPAQSPERIQSYAAVQLFTDRARLVMPDFVVTQANSSAVARLCQRLDGIPLALEMAAAWMHMLSAEQLADRLDDALRLLTDGSREALPRQQTLRATLDWSYQLLGGPQRLLLARLSVFSGGFTLEAAEAICSVHAPGAELESGQVLEVLAALVSKSLVIAGHTPGEGQRYYLLETVRQYAREKLDTEGETGQLLTRHRDYFLSFAETNFPSLQTPEAQVWRPRLTAEHDNLRQAVNLSFSDPSNPEAGPRLITAMRYGPWNWHQEELDWHLRGLELCRSNPAVPAQLHAKLLEHASMLSSRYDPQTTLALAIEAVEVSRRLGPEGKETLMWNLVQLARVAPITPEGLDRAVASMAEAQAILLALKPGHYAPDEELRVKAHFANRQSELANEQGRYAIAKQHAAESIRLYGASGSRWFASLGHTQLGVAHLALAEYQQAEDHFLAAVNLTRDLAGWDQSYLWLCLAQVDHCRGNLDRAQTHCSRSIRQAHRSSDRNLVADGLGVLAAIHAAQGHPAQAACLSGVWAAHWSTQKIMPREDLSLETVLPGWREHPQMTAIRAAHVSGLAMDLDEAIIYALGDQPN